MNEDNIRLTPKNLYIEVPKNEQFATVELEKGFILENGKGRVWKILVGDKVFGVYCNPLQLNLIQGEVTIHENKPFNTLRIPLTKDYLSTEFKFWMRKPPYRRSKKLKAYIENRAV